MTEQEYINVRELSDVNTAITSLASVTPKNSLAISVEDFEILMKGLHVWRERLYEINKVNK